MAGPITGLRGAFLQPATWGRNELGNYTIWSFEGTKLEVYAVAAAYAQTLGLAYEVKESFGKFRLEIHFPWSMNGIDPRTDLVSNWEFFAQHAEKDLLESAVENSSTIGQLSIQQIATIRYFRDNPPDGKNITLPTPTNFQTAGESSASATIALNVLTLMLQGVRNYPVEVPSLRRTIVTSLQYALSYALLNVRQIISTSSLVRLENVPSNLLFNLPFEASSNPALVYGWYKSFPTIQQVALLKWQIVQEWQYGLWSTLIWNNPL